MKKEIEVLDKIENDVIIPLYMERAKDGVTEEFIKEKMAAETWFTANEINELFNVTMLSEEKKLVCCADKNVLERYSNVPKELLNQMSEVNEMDKEIKIAELENTIATLENEKASLEVKLNEANEKVISLNDKVAELQPIVDKYNEKMAKEEEEKNAKLVNEKREYYKNKFEQLGARSKFESEEVQNLINNCIKDDKSMSKLNLMIVDLISVENAKPKAKTEKVADMDNLLVIEDDAATKYGFR